VSFEFDPDKDATKIAKHSLSLADFEGFDSESRVVPDDRTDYGEKHYLAFEMIDGLLHCVVFTFRGKSQRLISFRRAHRKEMRRYD
jgi:uncharacterized DUF497 family protein